MFSTACLSQEFEFSLTNQEGEPLQNAVIELFVSKGSNAEKASTHIMDQVNKSFQPQFLLIPQGSAVSFPNSDNIRHHVYSFSKAKPFEIKLYSGKPEAPITFPDSGVVVLGCNIHDSMEGYIYVSQSHYAGISDVNGKVRISVPAKVNKATIWHAYHEQGAEIRVDITDQVLENQQAFTINVIIPQARNTFENMFKQ